MEGGCVKKILITGMTRRQANASTSRAKQDYLTAPIIFYNILKKIKWFKVEWRPIMYGEDLSSYDLILIGLSSPNSLSNIFLFQSMWATRYPHLFFVDDFKVKGCFSGHDISNLYRDFTFVRQKLSAEERKTVLRDKRYLMKEFALNIDNDVDALLAPLFEWGDHKLLIEDTPVENVYGIDPSPFITNNKIVMDKKERKWICPALYDYSDKLKRWKLSWSVEYYHKKNYISEAELEKECDKAYGILSPKYSHAGSGWWRNRFNMAINTNSLLIAHHDEIKDLGDGMSYDVLSNIDVVESMSDVNLRKLILSQRETFLNKVKTKKYNIKKMENIVIHAIEDN